MPLVMHPKDPDILFSAVAKGQPRMWRGRETGAEAIVIRSTDGGATWKTLETGFPGVTHHFVEAIAIDPVTPDRVFLATRGGELLFSEDGGEHWSDMGVTIPEASDMKAVHIP